MSATGVLLVAVLVDRWLNPASWAFSSYALAAFVLLSLVRWLRGHSTVVPMDDETLALLDSAPEVDVSLWCPWWLRRVVPALQCGCRGAPASPALLAHGCVRAAFRARC